MLTALRLVYLQANIVTKQNVVKGIIIIIMKPYPEREQEILINSQLKENTKFWEISKEPKITKQQQPLTYLISSRPS